MRTVADWSRLKACDVLGVSLQKSPVNLPLDAKSGGLGGSPEPGRVSLGATDQAQSVPGVGTPAKGTGSGGHLSSLGDAGGLLLGNKSKPRGLDLKHDYNISFADVVVAVVTSSSTIEKRLPLLQQAWLGSAPFRAFVITDADNATALTLPEGLDIRTVACSGELNGLVCKTRVAFETFHREFRDKRWFLRLMDDTLVVTPNLLRLLRRLDPDKPW
jgi:hypothetical protein